jgi:hypothetical protein
MPYIIWKKMNFNIKSMSEWIRFVILRTFSSLKKRKLISFEKLLSSVKENFSTNRVHIGMDEAVMLGLGNYLKENGYKKGSLIIEEHCNRVVDICRKLELKPMIWSDMYITANSTGGYYDLPENTDCSKWEKPKKDLGLVYWDYYHADTRTYEKMLDIHAQLSDNVIFPGSNVRHF